jgi:hypothetical protein
MNLYLIDFLAEGRWFTYSIRTTSLFDAACELMTCEKGAVISAIEEVE